MLTHQAKENESTLEFDAMIFGDNERSNLEISFDDLSGDAGYLDYFLRNYQRKLAAADHPLIFRSFESLKFSAVSFQVTGLKGTMSVWDISNPHLIHEMPFTVTTDAGNIKAYTDRLKEMVVFDPSVLPSPAFNGKVPNQNLHGLNAPDLLVITTTTFLSEAERLAAFRSFHEASPRGYSLRDFQTII